jgi:hypothetical protein
MHRDDSRAQDKRERTEADSMRSFQNVPPHLQRFCDPLGATPQRQWQVAAVKRARVATNAALVMAVRLA